MGVQIGDDFHEVDYFIGPMKSQGRGGAASRRDSPAVIRAEDGAPAGDANGVVSRSFSHYPLQPFPVSLLSPDFGRKKRQKKGVPCGTPRYVIAGKPVT
jgi:hypothetical protein